MYTPKYYITNKVLHHIVNFEIAFKEITNLPLPARQKKQLYEQKRTENLFYVGKLIGLNITMKDAEKVFKGKEINVLKEPKVVLVNYRNAIEFIKQVKRDRYMSFSAATIVHLNKLLTNNWVDSWNGGRYRNQGESPVSNYDRWESYHNKELSQINIQNHLNDLFSWVTETRFLVHPLIKTAVTVFELFQYAPFLAANQLTTLATVELLFSELNIWQNGLIPTSLHFYTYEEEYFEALIASRESNDLTSWIERFVRGVSMDIQNLNNQMIQIEKEKVQNKRKMLLGLNSRQLRALTYLKRKLKITRKEYTDMMGVSFMTAFRDLTEMSERKLINQYGHGRSTYYTMSSKEEMAKNIDFEEERFKKMGTVTDE
ncbi:hypothetical protein JW962_03020 [Candidatus Dojkabacteria bacterium]|nr:hypothetical protein [Candidatus Dojkabacteria bacterium]